MTSMPTTEAPAAELSDYEKERGKPMPSLNHGVIQAELIGAFLRDRKFSIVSELSLELPDGTKMTPDICVYPRLKPDWGHDTIRMKAMPKLAVEIISPTQGFQVIADKLDLYFKYGIESVWVVQPGMQAIAIYLADQDRPQVFTTGEAKDPVTGLTARLEDIFA